jgi:hypothetical protein
MAPTRCFFCGDRINDTEQGCVRAVLQPLYRNRTGEYCFHQTCFTKFQKIKSSGYVAVEATQIERAA